MSTALDVWMQRHGEKEGLLRKDSLFGGRGLSILLSFADIYLRYLNRLDVGSNWVNVSWDMTRLKHDATVPA